METIALGRAILTRAGRESDYVEVGLNSGVCYNPLRALRHRLHSTAS